MTTLANTARVLSWLQNKTEKRVFKTQKPRFFWQFSREFKGICSDILKIYKNKILQQINNTDKQSKKWWFYEVQPKMVVFAK